MKIGPSLKIQTLYRHSVLEFQEERRKKVSKVHFSGENEVSFWNFCLVGILLQLLSALDLLFISSLALSGLDHLDASKIIFQLPPKDKIFYNR